MTDEADCVANLTVEQAGWQTQVVDPGRPHCRGLGLPLGGAADRAALMLGNALVGNPADAAALEICLTGPTLAVDAPIAAVVFGAPFELVGERHSCRAGKSFVLAPGERLRIGGTATGMRAYFCVRGGLQLPAVLGSRSGLGPLAAGTVLPCRSGVLPARTLQHAFAWNADPRQLRTIAGRQAAWFMADAFYARSFEVTPASNRMGLRLRDEPLAVPARELVSEPVCPGAVQVTRDGQCIVLGVDGQTIGGYPKIAHVIAADLDKLAQLRPGEAVRFQQVSLEDAESLYRQKQAELREWLTRLRTTAG